MTTLIDNTNNDFHGADANPWTSSNWSNITNLQRLSSLIRGSGNFSGVGGADANTSMASADNWASFTVPGLSGTGSGNVAGIHLRQNGTTFYRFRVVKAGAAYNGYFQRVESGSVTADNGPATDLASFWSEGTIFYFEVQGSTLKLKMGGTGTGADGTDRITPWTDTGIASGNGVGIYIDQQDVSAITIDNFQAGNFSAGGGGNSLFYVKA